MSPQSLWRSLGPLESSAPLLRPGSLL